MCWWNCAATPPLIRRKPLFTRSPLPCGLLVTRCCLSLQHLLTSTPLRTSEAGCNTQLETWPLSAKSQKLSQRFLPKSVSTSQQAHSEAHWLHEVSSRGGCDRGSPRVLMDCWRTTDEMWSFFNMDNVDRDMLQLVFKEFLLKARVQCESAKVTMGHWKYLLLSFLGVGWSMFLIIAKDRATFWTNFSYFS